MGAGMRKFWREESMSEARTGVGADDVEAA